MPPPFVRKVWVRQYKSIEYASVRLAALSFLVGPNGAGKSNFLDALRFVADALTTSVEEALRARGGIDEVRRRSPGGHTSFVIRLAFDLEGVQGEYAVAVRTLGKGRFEVGRERCCFKGEERPFFEVRTNQKDPDAEPVVTSSFEQPPPASRHRLYLPAVSGRPELRDLGSL